MDNEIKKHFPRLNTILRVEELIRNAEEPLKKNEIDRRLSKKIMRQTLNTILNYLENSEKILLTEDGFIWVFKDSAKKINQPRRI